MFAQLIDARYFEYLLTRFTEPNELFGPVDISAFREGRYTRRTERMLPTAEIVFLDEIFKSNSAILNSLLTSSTSASFRTAPRSSRAADLAVRRVERGARTTTTSPRCSIASSCACCRDNLDSYHFHELMKKGSQHEMRRSSTGRAGVDRRPPVSARASSRELQQNFDKFMAFPEEFLTKYKGLVFQIRSEGISVSDRRAVKLLKLFAASACSTAARASHDGDFFVLAHLEQPRSGRAARGDRQPGRRRATTASTRTSAASSARRRRSTICSPSSASSASC